MALKATIYKAELQLSDLDRGLYLDLPVTIARHPSETDERMMVRLLAFALCAPPDESNGALELAKDMWEAEEPALWQKDLTGRVVHWVEVGQPDEKRLQRASARMERVSAYSFASSAATWWKGVREKVVRLPNVAAWQIASEHSQALAALAQRTMILQVTVQDGSVWVGDGERSVEVTPQRLL